MSKPDNFSDFRPLIVFATSMKHGFFYPDIFFGFKRGLFQFDCHFVTFNCKGLSVISYSNLVFYLFVYSLLMLFCLTTTLLQSCDGMLVNILVKGPDCIGLLRLHLNVKVVSNWMTPE
jgi:hypothetical protein